MGFYAFLTPFITFQIIQLFGHLVFIGFMIEYTGIVFMYFSNYNLENSNIINMYKV